MKRKLCAFILVNFVTFYVLNAMDGREIVKGTESTGQVLKHRIEKNKVVIPTTQKASQPNNMRFEEYTEKQRGKKSKLVESCKEECADCCGKIGAPTVLCGCCVLCCMWFSSYCACDNFWTGRCTGELYENPLYPLFGDKMCQDARLSDWFRR